MIGATVRTRGLVVVKLFDERGRLKQTRRSKNIVTDAGDELYARLSAGNNAAGGPPTMMMLGTLSGTPAKNGTNANLTGWYSLSGGNGNGDNSIRALDSGYPSFASKGAGLGWRVTYRCTWSATYLANNNATFFGITAAILANVSPVPSNTGSARPTNAQVAAVDTFSTINKSQQDTLVITWYQDFLGGT